MANSNAYDVHCILFGSLLPYTRWWGLYLLWRVSHHCRVTSLSGFVHNFLSFIFCPCPENLCPRQTVMADQHIWQSCCAWTHPFLFAYRRVSLSHGSLLVNLPYKCRSELKRYKPDREPGPCMVELVMPSTRASCLKEGGHHSHCKRCMFIWQFFSVVKSLITTKSVYYDNSLTDGITVIEEGSLFSNWHIHAMWIGGCLGGHMFSEML